MDLASWDMETIKSNVCCYFIGRALKQSCYVSWLVLVCGQARSVLAKRQASITPLFKLCSCDN